MISGYMLIRQVNSGPVQIYGFSKDRKRLESQLAEMGDIAEFNFNVVDFKRTDDFKEYIKIDGKWSMM